MTDIIVEDETGIISMTWRDDGINQVTLISSKSSVLQKKIKLPSSYKKALRILSK